MQFADKKEVKVLGGALVCAGIGYLLYRRFWKEDPQAPAEPQGPKTTFHFERASSKFLSAKERVEVFKKSAVQKFEELAAAAKTDGAELSEATLLLVKSLVLSISEKEFAKIMQTNRKARRQVLDADSAKYELICVDGIREYEVLYADNLREVLAALKVSQDYFDLAVQKHLPNNPDVHLTGRQIYSALVDRLPAFNVPEEPTTELTEKASQYMLATYKRLSPTFRPVAKEYASTVFLSLIQDLLEDEFELEEEDMRKLIKQADSEAARATREELKQELIKLDI